jgi:hypothetical protein
MIPSDGTRSHPALPPSWARECVRIGSVATGITWALLALTACISPTPTSTLLPQPSSIPSPTATPTPFPPHILLVENAATSELSLLLRDTVTGLAEGDGLRVIESSTLDTVQLEAAPKAVIFLGSDPSGLPLAETHPEINVLVIDIDRGAISGRVETSAREFELHRSFVGGYAAVLMAPEYRVGAILPDTAEAAGAFVQGTIYHCGLCNPAFPPFVEYPLVERATNEAEALAALTSLAAADVEVVYLGPGLATDASAQLASELGMITLGADAPPSQSEGAWAATLAPDLVQALEQAWQALGEPSGAPVVPRVRLEHVDAGKLSPGRQTAVLLVADQLHAGSVQIRPDFP